MQQREQLIEEEKVFAYYTLGIKTSKIRILKKDSHTKNAQ